MALTQKAERAALNKLIDYLDENPEEHIGTAVGILDQIHPMRLAPNPSGTAWGSCNPGRS